MSGCSTWSTLRTWTWPRWAVATAASTLTGVAIAVPTALIRTPWFGREVPPTWWSVPLLLASALLSGVLAATYVADQPAQEPVAPRRALGGGLLTFLAVGCPVCNKLVLMALGTTGAISWFAPVQLPLGVIAVGLLLHAVRQRLRTADGCVVGAPADAAVRS